VADPNRPGDADAAGPPATAPSPRRPLIERVGLALVALVLAALFGTVAVAAWSGGELFLAAMGAIGCLMTVWVGTLTLIRG
jgi:fatty acid desaturase